MYAIIETGGKQYWVTPGETLKVEKLAAEKGQTLTFNALWAAEEQGAKSSRSAKVTAEVVDAEAQGPKILVFKKRTKKAYKKMKGHRQDLTKILIKEISLN
jgi:large subunit ribosomal protein L21